MSEELISKAKSDPEAAGILYDRHFQSIYRYIYRSTFDLHLAEDLTSNVFVSAFANLEKFEWRKIPFEAWLYRIAVNEIRMFRRKSAKVKFVSLEGGANSSSRRVNALSTAGPGADNQLEQREDILVLHGSLEELKPKYREAIVLRFFEEKTIAEISKILGKREGTVNSLLHRGLAKLQRSLISRGVLKNS